MIRSRSIPPVLSRATGDGIHAILLIDADSGELLGSYGSLPPPPSSSPLHQTDGNGSSNNQQQWPPLDAASIGALISEVAGDYRRMGEELWLLDPSGHSSPSNKKGGKQGGHDGGGPDGSSGGGGSKGGDRDMADGSGSSSSAVGSGGGKGGSQQGAGDKDKGNLDSDGFSGSNLKSLVIEMEYGVVGVASAGPDFYVIAIADSTVQHGALTGRLRVLGSHVREAMSQLE